jgi:hypothetical protein
VTERLLKTAVVRAEKNFMEAVEIVVSEVQGNENENGGAGAILQFQRQQAQEEIVIEKEEVRPPAGKKWTTSIKNWAGKIYLRRGDRQEQKKKTLLLGLGFLVVMAVFFGGGQLMNQKKRLEGSEMTKKVEKIVFDFNEAKAMAVLNPARSRELLGDIKKTIEQFGETKKYPKLDEVKAEWQSVWEQAAGIIQVKLEEVVDLNLIREGMVGQRMGWGDNKLIVLDNQVGKVAEIDAKTGAGKIIAGGDGMVGAKRVTVYPGRVMVLGQKEIWEINGDKLIARVNQDGVIDKAADMKMWAGNIYILEATASGGMIWRYQAAAEMFSAGKEWLAGCRKVELAAAGNMAIDGDIWVLGQGRISKYTRGVRADFGVSGLEEGLEGKSLYTDENGENLYILDVGKVRVVVIKKTGEYVKQYKNEKIQAAEDLIIDEKSGVGYILAEGKIWRMPL